MEIKATGMPAQMHLNSTDPRSLEQLKRLGDSREGIEAVATQIETLFTNMMLKAMRQTVPEGGLLGEGMGGKMFVQMLDQEYAQMGAMPRDPRFHEALVRQLTPPGGLAESAPAKPAGPSED